MVNHKLLSVNLPIIPTSIDDLALVIPTFIRRKSATNPMPFRSFDRTQEKMATSFSRPC